MKLLFTLFSVSLFAGCVYPIEDAGDIPKAAPKVSASSEIDAEVESGKSEVTATSTKTSRQKSYKGEMNWSYVDESSFSLCGPDIEAKVSMELDLLQNGSIEGKGTIVYKDVHYSSTRQCGDCVIQGESGTFLVKGKYEGNVLTLHPQTAVNGKERQHSSVCFAETGGYEESQHVLFSLEKAGFFDEWTVDIGVKNSEKKKDFLWELGDRVGKGTFQVQ